MQTCLVSNSETLYALVSEIVGTELGLSAPGSSLPDANVYLWDYDPATPMFRPSQPKRGAKHIFLVARKDLNQFGSNIKTDDACIILKPVNRAILSAFFAPQPELHRDNVDGLRADRQALLQSVLQANLKLQEYDADRTNFLARALHDVRAPLTALQGYCELLFEGQLGPLNEQQINLLHHMRGSSRRLRRLTSGMFDLSVHGRVQRTLQLEQGEIENSVNQALHELGFFLQEKEITVDIQLDPPDQPLFIEVHQIEQVLINLLENSCKFAPKRGEIEIRGSSVFWLPKTRELDDSAETPNAYRIDIHDSGPGIETHLIDTIFEEYTSYSGGTDRSGGGLGLAICRRIVEAHEGAIWAQTGKFGPTFSFVLPFEPRIASAHPGPASEGLKGVAVRVG